MGLRKNVGETLLTAASVFARRLTVHLDVTNLFDKVYVWSCYSTLWCWYGGSRNVQASLSYRM